MPYPRKYDRDAILADWRSGLTTKEIGAKYFAGLKRPTRSACTYLRLTFGLRVNDDKSRAVYAGPYRRYPDAEKALWRTMRATMTVHQIVEARRAAGVELNYASVFHNTADIKGPRAIARPLTAREVREVRALHREHGWLPNDIAARYERPVSTIRRHLEKGGPVMRRRPRTPEEIFAPWHEIAGQRAA